MVETTNIIPITKARGKLGILAEKVRGRNFIVLTKGGSPRAALVDISYLAKLEEEVGKIYQRTFINPKLKGYIREFTDYEIEKWRKEDEL